MANKKVVHFKHEFIGEGEEDLRDIFARQLVRYINQQKGYSCVRLKSN